VLREIGHPIILERIHNGKPLPLFNPEEYNKKNCGKNKKICFRYTGSHEAVSLKKRKKKGTLSIDDKNSPQQQMNKWDCFNQTKSFL